MALKSERDVRAGGQPDAMLSLFGTKLSSDMEGGVTSDTAQPTEPSGLTLFGHEREGLAIRELRARLT